MTKDKVAYFIEKQNHNKNKKPVKKTSSIFI